MLVRNLFRLLFLSFIIISCGEQNKIDSIDEKYSAELNNHADQYMKQLKSVLVSNLKEGGPIKAVNICSDTASILTDEYSHKMKINVKRFSFKNRNLKNIPDSFESEALREFENLLKRNELKSNSYMIKEVMSDSSSVVKFVKPILVDAPCLNCHGSESQISDDVKQVLNQKYPDDKATGYKIGDLRGAISVSKIL